MCDNDFTPEIRSAFDEACRVFGWRSKTITVDHERDDNCSWAEQVWMNDKNVRLFSESNLEIGLCREIIRLAKLVEVLQED